MNEAIKDLDIDNCLRLLGENYIGRLGFISYSCPYIIPITYFHDVEEKSILSYSSEGNKIDAMRKFPSVSLQIDEINTIQHWKSVLIHGKFEELKGSTAKKYLKKFSQGVQETISKKIDEKPKFISDFSSRLSERKLPIVFRIRIKDISGKYRAS
ncbi:flavin mononucleotide-binding protein [Flagellimonas hymeniacidonis]|uniref:Flavin mononucleotide-binding protein n=1 Tax=Flagellimonas hymeniacidonis TaxID=2603628 RepID=A0A5C8V3B5_9FLAO|nr:pyridoxamine 5'-phosphate oxidase family protein [Flagellimonas hymeniacidonis]TXN36034.1 flavin mononucleotide-binding protein [Flagellimonas hymeniacidonis]